MRWHEFIFSNKSQHRTLRHATFWLCWWFFFYGSFYAFQQLQNKYITWITWSPDMVLKSSIIVLTHMFACYCILYIVLPLFLEAQRSIAAAGFLIVIVVTVASGYLVYTDVFPLIDRRFGSTRIVPPETMMFVSLNSGLLSGAKVIAAALTIKLLKTWWLKQKEKEQLEKEKIDTELQLLRAQIHPQFLFSTLNSIKAMAQIRSPKTPEILLKLSDLLSYMLYDCARPSVPLDDEIRMMKDYMLLETVKYNDRLDLEIQVKGSLKNKRVAPFLLLPFIENSFTHCSYFKSDRPWINLEISVDDTFITMKLINGLAHEAQGESLDIITARLQALYPGDHQLKINSEEEMLVVVLKVPLEKIHQLMPDDHQPALT
jgi:sensor histidine kinase YesM